MSPIFLPCPARCRTRRDSRRGRSQGTPASRGWNDGLAEVVQAHHEVVVRKGDVNVLQGVHGDSKRTIREPGEERRELASRRVNAIDTAQIRGVNVALC